LVPGKSHVSNAVRRAGEAFCRAGFKPVALGIVRS
jgi:hypothetical protein